MSSIACPIYPANSANKPPDKKYAPKIGSLLTLSPRITAAIDPINKNRPKAIKITPIHL